jgi:hypothetical protein
MRAVINEYCHTRASSVRLIMTVLFEAFLFQTSVHSHWRQQSSHSHLFFIRRLTDAKY